MKKLFLTVILTVATATFASSQLYIGGSLNLNTSGQNSKDFDGTDAQGQKTFGFGIAPRIGYYLNDNFSFGVSIGIQYEKQTSVEPADWNSSTNFNISPYARYAFFTYGKFKVNLEGGLGLAFGSNNEKDQPSDEKFRNSNFNIFVVPVLTYDLTDRIALETSLNFCSLQFTSSTRTHKSGEKKATNTTNSFGIGANTADVFSLGDISVGFIYKF